MSRARWLSGAPATKKSVPVVRTIIIVVPMSGSTMTSPPTTLTTRTKGAKPRLNLLISWRRPAPPAGAGDQQGQQPRGRSPHYRRRHVAQLPVVQAHEVDQRRQSHEGVERLTRYEVRGAAEIHIAPSEAGRG